MTTGIRCGNCGSNRTNWLADAVGCEMCGAATRVDGTMAHGPTVDPDAVAAIAADAEEARAAYMTTTETVAADEDSDEETEEAAELEDLTVAELREQAAEQDIEGRSGMNKDELVKALGG